MKGPRRSSPRKSKQAAPFALIIKGAKGKELDPKLFINIFEALKENHKKFPRPRRASPEKALKENDPPMPKRRRLPDDNK